jgi:hypothetical protein
MDENLKYYLENTVMSKSAIESRLTHPITKLRYPTRLVYVNLKKYANDFLKSGSEPRFVSLAGLRELVKQRFYGKPLIIFISTITKTFTSLM